MSTHDRRLGAFPAGYGRFRAELLIMAGR